MSKVKVDGKEYDESYLGTLIKRDKGAVMADKLYKKGCGHCGNDIHQPYNYCHYCGYKVNEAPKELRL